MVSRAASCARLLPCLPSGTPSLASPPAQPRKPTPHLPIRHMQALLARLPIPATHVTTDRAPSVCCYLLVRLAAPLSTSRALTVLYNLNLVI